VQWPMVGFVRILDRPRTADAGTACSEVPILGRPRQAEAVTTARHGELKAIVATSRNGFFGLGQSSPRSSAPQPAAVAVRCLTCA
jgi:hypothetical protein